MKLKTVAVLVVLSSTIGCLAQGTGIESDTMRGESQDFALIAGYFAEQMFVLDEVDTSQQAYADGFITKEEHEANLTDAREDIDSIEEEIQAHEFTEDRIQNLLRQMTDQSRDAIDAIENCAADDTCPVVEDEGQAILETYGEVLNVLIEAIE